MTPEERYLAATISLAHIGSQAGANHQADTDEQDGGKR